MSGKRSRDAGGRGCGSGHRRNRLPQAGQGVLRRGRQYTGSAGKITNCQIGVFGCYATPRGHAFLDRELYLPKSWTDDKARMAKAHVPQEIITRVDGGFSTKPALALAMIARAIAAKVPFSFVAADTAYGVGDIEMALRRAGKGYVLGVKSSDAFRSWGKPEPVAGAAKDIAEALPNAAWRRLSAGEGTKGERLHDWAYLELADLDAGDYDAALDGQIWTRGLLIWRKLADGDLAFFTTWAPKGTTIEKLAAIEGRRWAIEDSFETAKNEPGLDHNETRSWHGWRRHVSLVLLAFGKRDRMTAFRGPALRAIGVHQMIWWTPDVEERRRAPQLEFGGASGDRR